MTRKDNILYWIVAAALLAGCATEDTILDSDNVPIRLAVTCQEMTRGTSGASSQETAFDANAKINVTITTSDATPVSICSGATFTASAASGGKNTLTPPDQTRPPYYPNGDKTVTIKAYYPSTVNTSTTTFTVQNNQSTSTDSETTDPYKLSDLMTSTVTGQVKTSEDVNLQFQHRMAKITISATVDKTDGENTDPIIITGIQLTNVKTQATYNNATDAWTGSGSTGNITVATAEASEKLSTLSGVALFPAQTITGQTFIQVITDKGTANYAVTSKEFQEGYDYSASLEVGLQNLTMTAAITDWSAASGTATVTKVLKYGLIVEPITQSYTYDGTAKEPTVNVTFKQSSTADPVQLIKDTHYTVSYYNNIAVGTAIVVVEGMAGTTYAGSASVLSFSIGKATPTLSFTAGEAVTLEFDWNSTYQTVIATGSKYNSNTTWTSSDKSVATVDGDGLVSISKPGVTTIKMSTDDRGNFEATSAQYTLTINKRSFMNHVSITEFGTYDTIYNGEAKEPVPVVWDGGTGGKRLGDGDGYYTIAYSNNVNVGSAATVTLTGGGIYYDATTVSKTFNITKVTPVITTSATAQTIGLAATYQFNATTTFGTITYSSSDATIASVNSSTGLITGNKAGTATITAAVASGGNWNAAESKTITITVKAMEETWTNVGSASYTCPVTAIYTFEVVGGAGGAYSGTAGGRGGLVKASKKLTEGTVVYLYVGAAGKEGSGASVDGGTNGSGTASGGKSGTRGGGSGGASSEIRIGGTAVGNRQLVAGGGGGSRGKRRAGGDGGSGSSGNLSSPNGEGATWSSTGAGGGGGYYGGSQGIMGGAYGGSNYVDSSWTEISNGVSSNGANDGYIKVTYAFE